MAQKESQLNALRTELTHKEVELNQLNTQIDALRSDVNNQRTLAAHLNNELEAQRSKNNVSYNMYRQSFSSIFI